MTVEVVDTLLQVLGYCIRCLEVRVVQGSFLQNKKPGFDEVQPRSIRRRPIELNVSWRSGPEVAGFVCER